MPQLINHKAVIIFGIVLSLFSLNGWGSVESEPHQKVEATTAQILALLDTGIDPSQEPEEFIQKVSEVLNPVVAFEYIAKGVMGAHAKNASAEQVKAFTATFKKRLVNTYGGGLSGFRDLDIKVLPPKEPVGNKRKVEVLQEVKNGTTVVNVSYIMGKNSQGQWKMLNLILNGVNFGKLFRGQFNSAINNNNGDLDKTIKQWEQGA